MKNTTYNGYKNYETWNIALWIQNDEGLYNIIRAFKIKSFKKLLMSLEIIGINKTPDNISFSDKKISHREIAEILKDLQE